MTVETDMQAALQVARETIQAQDEFIKAIAEQSKPYATVLALFESHALVSMNGNIHEVNLPKSFKPLVGSSVVLVPKTGQIFSAGDVNVRGVIATVRTPGPVFTTVLKNSESTSVFSNPNVKLEAGDSVYLDSSGQVILEKAESVVKSHVKTGTGVCWDDIGGLDEVKSQMVEIIELPFREPGIFAHYGYTPPRGVLLSGPPGCGKTMLGKAAATAIGKAHGSDGGFIYVKGPEVLNKYVGESESRVRSLFDQARAHKKKTGAPAVIFIDEAEALLSSRGMDRRIGGMEGTIVPTFLAEMDGIEESSAVVILATNRPEQLDTAVVRDGRVDRKIEVTRPDPETVAQIAFLNLKKCPVHETTHIDLAKEVVREMVSSSNSVYRVTSSNGASLDMGLIDLASGAMVTNLVERAKSFALKRDLSERKTTGVGLSDIRDSARMILYESRRIDHSEEVREFGRKHGIDPVKVERIAA